MTIEKYGYEADQEKTKTAEDGKSASQGKCPICGATLTGKPPTCPTHGSEPFEKRNRDGQG